jgi:hypothetical protein
MLDELYDFMNKRRKRYLIVKMIWSGKFCPEIKESGLTKVGYI